MCVCSFAVASHVCFLASKLQYCGCSRLLKQRGEAGEPHPLARPPGSKWKVVRGRNGHFQNMHVGTIVLLHEKCLQRLGPLDGLRNGKGTVLMSPILTLPCVISQLLLLARHSRYFPHDHHKDHPGCAQPASQHITIHILPYTRRYRPLRPSCR